MTVSKVVIYKVLTVHRTEEAGSDVQTSQWSFAPNPVAETIENTGLRCLILNKNAVLCAALRCADLHSVPEVKQRCVSEFV